MDDMRVSAIGRLMRWTDEQNRKGRGVEGMSCVKENFLGGMEFTRLRSGKREKDRGC